MLDEYRNTQPNQRQLLDEPNIRSDILVTNRIVELLGDVRGLEVLELGSGNGKVARMLARLGARVTGVDVVQEQVDIAKKNSSPEIAYVQADFSDAGLLQKIPIGPYDRVLSVMSLFYLSSSQISQALANVRELLKPDGLFILGTASSYRGLKKSAGFDYFKEQETGVVLPSKTGMPFTTTYIHLPLESLMNECIKNGLVLTKFIEPRATMEEQKQYPDILSENDIVMPDYLILEFKAS